MLLNDIVGVSEALARISRAVGAALGGIMTGGTIDYGPELSELETLPAEPHRDPVSESKAASRTDSPLTVVYLPSWQRDGKVS